MLLVSRMVSVRRDPRRTAARRRGHPRPAGPSATPGARRVERVVVWSGRRSPARSRCSPSPRTRPTARRRSGRVRPGWRRCRPGSAVLVEDSVGAWLEYAFPGAEPGHGRDARRLPRRPHRGVRRLHRGRARLAGFVARSGARVAVLVDGSALTSARCRTSSAGPSSSRDGPFVYLVAPGARRDAAAGDDLQHPARRPSRPAAARGGPGRRARRAAGQRVPEAPVLWRRRMSPARRPLRAAVRRRAAGPAGSNLVAVAPGVAVSRCTPSGSASRSAPRAGASSPPSCRCEGRLVGVVCCHLSLDAERRRARSPGCIEVAGAAARTGRRRRRPQRGARRSVWAAARAAGFVDHGASRWRTFPADRPDAAASTRCWSGRASQVLSPRRPGRATRALARGQRPPAGAGRARGLNGAEPGVGAGAGLPGSSGSPRRARWRAARGTARRR